MSVYRTIGPLVLIFDTKHRLWVLIRTAWPRRFQRVPTINVLNKHIKNNKIFFNEISSSIFTGEKIICILHGQILVMQMYVDILHFDHGLFQAFQML